jgi:hypothetical protein
MKGGMPDSTKAPCPRLILKMAGGKSATRRKRMPSGWKTLCLVAALLVPAGEGHAKGCFHSGWNGILLGYPLILSARFSEMFLAETQEYDYRVSANLEAGISGVKASLDHLLVLTDTYCREGQGGPGRGYWGANQESYWKDSAWSLGPAVIFLWLPGRHRDAAFLGVELGYLNLRNYISLMSPWKVSAGTYMKYGNADEWMGTVGTGFSW